MTARATTWEEAAQDAADAVQRIRSWENDVLDEIELDLVKLKDDARDPIFHWSYVAGEAICGALGADNGGSTGAADIENALADVVATVITKQHDYGHQNILWGGIQGVVLRAHDKVARIRNLRERGVDPANESLKDSWTDIAGYALIGYMLEVGTFELPLASDAYAESTYDPNEGEFFDITDCPIDDVVLDEAEEEAIRKIVQEAIGGHWILSHNSTVMASHVSASEQQIRQWINEALGMHNLLMHGRFAA